MAEYVKVVDEVGNVFNPRDKVTDYYIKLKNGQYTNVGTFKRSIEAYDANARGVRTQYEFIYNGTKTSHDPINLYKRRKLPLGPDSASYVKAADTKGQGFDETDTNTDYYILRDDKYELVGKYSGTVAARFHVFTYNGHKTIYDRKDLYKIAKYVKVTNPAGDNFDMNDKNTEYYILKNDFYKLVGKFTERTEHFNFEYHRYDDRYYFEKQDLSEKIEPNQLYKLSSEAEPAASQVSEPTLAPAPAAAPAPQPSDDDSSDDDNIIESSQISKEGDTVTITLHIDSRKIQGLIGGRKSKKHGRNKRRKSKRRRSSRK